MIRIDGTGGAWGQVFSIIRARKCRAPETKAMLQLLLLLLRSCKDQKDELLALRGHVSAARRGEGEEGRGRGRRLVQVPCASPWPAPVPGGRGVSVGLDVQDAQLGVPRGGVGPQLVQQQKHSEEPAGARGWGGGEPRRSVRTWRGSTPTSNTRTVVVVVTGESRTGWADLKSPARPES